MRSRTAITPAELGLLPTLPRSSFVPLLYHNLGGLSRGFLHFFSSLRRWVSGSDRQIYQRSAGSDFGGTPCAPLPLTMIVYHTPPQKSTWQSAQIRASKLFNFCATFLLTNCWRYGIMEILRASLVGAQLKKTTAFQQSSV